MASMLAPSIWVSTDHSHRRLFEVIPSPVRKAWDKWNVRGSILLSFLCQIIIGLMGNRRKHTVSKLTDTLVWGAYLLSDWVANFGLGVISSKIGDPIHQSNSEQDDDSVLLAFWATLFLVHLGGPASITAYALEDNALWRRSLALWLIQSIRVLYIVLLAWRNTGLSYLSIAMLVNGFIKYGERTWALYSASIDYRRDKMIPPLDPTIHGKKFIIEESTNDSNHLVSLDDHESKAALDIIRTPQDLLDNFMHLFVSLFKDLVLSYDYLQKHQSYFRELKPEHAFGMVAVQLGYAYNFFYTKASVFHRDLFINLVAITLFLETGVLICFGFIINAESHMVTSDQIMLTWSLLVEIVLLDAWSSDVVTNSNEQFYLPYVLHSSHSSNVDELYGFYEISSKRTWVNVIPQCNFLTLSLQHNKDSVNFNQLKELLNKRILKPTKELHHHIFNHLIKKSELISGGQNVSKYGVNDAIEARGLKSIEWTKMLEFHQSILTWHVATDICYYYSITDHEDDDPKKSISKMISEYMLYILVKQRHMLPVGTGLISFRDTCAETIQVLRQLKIELPSKNVQEACEKLLGVRPDSVRRSESKSVIVEACRLARSLVIEMEKKEMWELLKVVWVEILVSAATQCKADQHAQQLRKGGEFLTHVWLLSAHLGIMEQFQVRPSLANPPMNQVNRNERDETPVDAVGEENL
ncbi:uncharacterized protein LOC129289469 isoform X2 [Prosopis cineraria]|uniref:uncharacterized protein LOC129289469 isoform X2 n=1 Tax=Prosopis cineraria TaxID=364024 RepID=UPI00240FDA65|nr:uncharacterized protein LOC129289469 isoform X2 [Prosopis cineraria]